MAIDTADKRRSILTFASPLAWGHLFLADGVVHATDRLTLLHRYGGQLTGSVPYVEPDAVRIVRHSGRYL